MSLQIQDLHASLENGTEILKGVTLEIPAGEIHAIMGPNGSGKSTLSKVIAGHESYIPTSGTITMDGQDISEMSIDERSRAGIFLAFQYPNEIPGVSNANFIRAALQVPPHRRRGHQCRCLLQVPLRENGCCSKMDRKFTGAPLNEGFSGGEKKRNEILQM